MTVLSGRIACLAASSLKNFGHVLIIQSLIKTEMHQDPFSYGEPECFRQENAYATSVGWGFYLNKGNADPTITSFS